MRAIFRIAWCLTLAGAAVLWSTAGVDAQCRVRVGPLGACVGTFISASISNDANSRVLVQQATGGVDEALTADQYEAFKFETISTANLGDVTIRLKKDAGVTGGVVRVYIYTDSAGPSVPLITPGEVTGYPTAVYVSSGVGNEFEIQNAYQEFTFRIPKDGPLADCYWIALLTEDIVGAGSIYLERRTQATMNLYATDADGVGAWTLDTTVGKEPYYVVQSRAGNALTSFSPNDYGIYGTTTSGWAGFFKALGTGAGVKGESYSNFGGGFTSYDFIGVRGSSENWIAVAGVSVNNVGGQFQGATGGIQVTCSGAACPGVQVIDQGNNTAVLWQGMTNAFAITSQISATGDISAIHQINSIGTSPSVASGFGTSPSVAGKDGAFRVNVGTGGAATSGVINFGSTWVATGVICTVAVRTNTTSEHRAMVATATTTQLTITSPSAWVASALLDVKCEGY